MNMLLPRPKRVCKDLLPATEVIPIVSRLLSNPPTTRPFFPGQMAQAGEKIRCDAASSASRSGPRHSRGRLQHTCWNCDRGSACEHSSYRGHTTTKA